jgi:pimeloyl-ACP methyl ester carboxylesterase
MKLNYRSVGEGPPLIILHGLFGASDNWLSIAKKLESQYQVFLVDQRNHGSSPHSDIWNYGVMADDIKEFMEEQHISEAIIMGHSMGGKVAMSFSKKFPEIITDLIMVDIGPKHYPVHHQKILAGLRSLDLDGLSSRQDADQQLQSAVPEMGVRMFLLKNLGRDKKNSFYWKINLEVIEEQIENVGIALPLEKMFDEKCLFIRGETSDYILDDDLPEIAIRFPHYQLSTVSGAGHWVHAERPDEFLNILTGYLNG